MSRGADTTREGTLACGRLLIDWSSHRVYFGRRIVHVPMTRMKLLEAFIEAAGRPLSREEIRRRVWGDEGPVDPRTVDKEIERLRRDLGGAPRRCPIKTVRGFGYILSFYEPRRPRNSF